MSNQEIHEGEIVKNPDMVDDLPDPDSLLKPPQLNVQVPAAQQPEEKECIVTDEMILGAYDEALDDARNDRKEIGDLLANFVEMVINEGDSTTASKEALCKLIELKLKATETKARIADLMTRVKLRERNTYSGSGPHMNAIQNNTYHIDKREMFREVKRLQGKITGKGKKHEQP